MNRGGLLESPLVVGCQSGLSPPDPRNLLRVQLTFAALSLGLANGIEAKSSLTISLLSGFSSSSFWFLNSLLPY